MADSGQDLSKAVADRYRVEREIGRGGMAAVFLAHDLRHDRDVAMKVLHPELAAALGADRFLAEIKTTARLQHPHILPLLDSGEADGVLFYVMPFVAGETLRARLDREHLLPIDDAMRIAREVADALEYAHRLGVIHRDIKPENILLQDGHALVADFGIALAVQQAGGARMTQTGLSLGTPQYMSPEQAMGERTIDARSDQYALAAVMYEMLVGDPPFTGSTVQAIVAKLMTERPTRIVTQRDRVPVHVESAVLRALEKIPADRWASVREFMDAMRDATLGSAATAAADATAVAPPATNGRAKRAKTIALGAGVLVLGTALGGWAASRSASPSRGAANERIVMTSIVPPAGGNFSEQQSLALSPDGQRLAFVFAAPDGSRNLWIRDIDKLDAKPIVGSTGGDIPFWSHDGRSLGFFARGYLQIMGPTGEVRRLCPVSQPNAGSWNASDVILFSDRHGISSVSASGNACRTIIPYDSGSVLRGVFLPDGKRFVYSRGRFANLTVANGDGKTLGTIPVQAQMFAVAEPDFLIYSNGRDAGAIDAQRVDFDALRTVGQATRVLSNVRSRSGIHTFAISREGTLAYLPGGSDAPYLDYDAGGLRDTIRVDGTWTLSARPARAGPPTIAVAGNAVGMWLYDFSTARASRLVVRDTGILNPQDGVGATWPVFSPDGSRLAYMAASRTECRVNEHDLKRDEDRVIARTSFVAMSGCASPVDWSQDGTKLLIKNDTALDVITLDGKVTARIARPGAIWEGHFSPDAKSVVFSSDETGRAEVYVMAIAGGVPTPLSSDGGRWPAWTADGRRIVFMSPLGKVQEVTMTGTSPNGAPRTVFTAQNWRRSTFDDRGAGFAVVGNGEHYIVRQSPSAYAVAYVQHWMSLLSR
ncbi:MAG: protein kinase [Gemmatimonadetes bacterium]|nr:protein kinase [Gemmatimonadota bacterium]